MAFKIAFGISIIIGSYCKAYTFEYCAETPLHEAARSGNVKYIQESAADDLYAEDCQGLTPMHVAIFYNRLHFMEGLVEADFDVNRLNGEALPILHYSVVNGSMETTKVLLTIGSIPNAVNALRETPLYLSLKKHDEAVSKLLVASGASMALRDDLGNTLSHAFVERKDLGALKVLVTLNGELDAENNNQKTPLLLAVKNNSPAIINFLLAHGASISKLPYMHSALRAKAYKSLRALLENGISTKTETEDGLSVIELVVKNELTEAVDILGSFRTDLLSGYSFSKQSSKKLNDNAYQIKDKDGNSVLHVSVKYNKSDIVKNLLSKYGGHNIDEEGEGGNTAMELAIRNDNTEIMEILASFGAEISRSSQEKGSLMKQAIMSESNKAVEWLINRGVNPMELDKDGNTYLHIAAKLGKFEALKALLSEGAVIIEKEGENNYTAMELAIKNDDTKIMELLASYGANIHRHNLLNESLLKKAVMEKSNKAVVWLISHGADREEKDGYGNTVLHIAVRLGEIQTIKSLLSKNGSAIVDIEGEEGNTAMELAIIHDRTDIMEVLALFGADVNRSSSTTGSLLKLAVMEKSNKAIIWLIDHGVDREKKDVYGNTVLHVAVRLGEIKTIMALLSKNGSAIVDMEGEKGNTAMELTIIQDRIDIMEVLASFGADIHRLSSTKGSLLKLAVIEKSNKAVVWLIDHGADREETDGDGNTLLHVAVKVGDIETIKILLSKNGSAIVDKEGAEGFTAMELAIIPDRIDIMEVLALFGADIHRPSFTRGSLLMLAVTEKSNKAIIWLIDHGVDRMEKDVHGNTVLHVAVSLGDIVTIKALLCKIGATIVDTEGEKGNTAMELAIIQDRTDIMEVLALFGADVQRSSSTRGSLLNLAVMEKSNKAVVWLIDHGADREEKDRDGNTVLHFAVRLGEIETIKELLSKNGSAIVDMEGEEGNTAMELAIIQDRTDIMEVLASFGADVHRSSSTRGSLLKVAVMEKSNKAVVWLIDHGADLEEKDGDGNTLLHVAVKVGDVETIKALLSKNGSALVEKEGADGNTAIELAVVQDRTEIMEVLASYGADIYRPRTAKGSLLYQAIVANSRKSIVWLIDHGADTNEKDNEGNTLLHIAAKLGKLGSVKALLSRKWKFDVNSRGKDDFTPLFNAVYSNHSSIIRELLNHGADIEAMVGPCHVLPGAAYRNLTESVLELLSHQVDVDSKCENGNTALIFSSALNNLKVVKKLLESGADVNIVGEEKKSALIWAIVSAYDISDKNDIVKVLLENGAEVNLRDDNGHTALFYAKKYGRKITIGLIESKGGISI